MVNPYKASTTPAAKSPPTIRYYVSAVLLVLGGLVVAAPSLIYLLANSMRAGMPRRYATYDEEVYLFNNSVPAATAHQIAFITVPLLFGLAALLLHRGFRNKRLERAEEA
ncbi:hypothetical protein SH139x_002311 [Planctomycetaceae bacterium SH139]